MRGISLIHFKFLTVCSLYVVHIVGLIVLVVAFEALNNEVTQETKKKVTT